MRIGSDAEPHVFDEDDLRANPEFQVILARLRDNSEKDGNLARLTREISDVEAEARHLLDETAAFRIDDLKGRQAELQERLAKLGTDFSALDKQLKDCSEAETNLNEDNQGAKNARDVWEQFTALLKFVIEEIKQANEIRHKLDLPLFRVPSEDDLHKLMTSRNVASLAKLLQQIETFYASARQS